MITVKDCVDKTMQKIIKNLDIPDYVRQGLSLEVTKIENQLCYSVLIDNARVSNIPIEQFYSKSKHIISRYVEVDVERYLVKVYSKTTMKLR